MFKPHNASIQAEEQIIDLILRSYTTSFDTRIKRLLASYPYEPPYAKDEIILEFFNKLCNSEKDLFAFEVFREFDILMTTLGKRGHFRHQFEVLLLGLVLIAVIATYSNRKSIGGLKSFDEILDCWFITSAFHDIGYPLELSTDIAGRLSSLYQKIHVFDLSERYDNITSNYDFFKESELLQINYKSNRPINVLNFLHSNIQRFLKISKKSADTIFSTLYENRNHGYISAIILCKNYIDFLIQKGYWETPGEEWRLDVLSHAATAIALHNPPKTGENWISNINFTKTPFAFLLFILDNLQEWDRSTGYSTKWPNYHLTSFKVINNCLHFTYTLNHEGWTSDLISDTQKYVSNQFLLLKTIGACSPRLKIKLSLAYMTNDSREIGKYQIAY